MTDAPSTVSSRQLKELGLRLRELSGTEQKKDGAPAEKA